MVFSSGSTQIGPSSAMTAIRQKHQINEIRSDSFPSKSYRIASHGKKSGRATGCTMPAVLFLRGRMPPGFRRSGAAFPGRRSRRCQAHIMRSAGRLDHAAIELIEPWCSVRQSKMKMQVRRGAQSSVTNISRVGPSSRSCKKENRIRTSGAATAASDGIFVGPLELGEIGPTCSPRLAARGRAYKLWPRQSLDQGEEPDAPRLPAGCRVLADAGS